MDKTKYVINPFDLRGVQLGESRFKHQFDEMVNYYMAIPNNDMLVGFRRRAGLPYPGTELGGWYSHDFGSPDFDELFNTFGQWLSGLARIYAITGDNDVLNKVKLLVSEWGKSIDPSGYFYYSQNCNAFHYQYDKTVGGLVDVLHYCSFEPAEKYLDQITQWAVKNLTRDRIPASPSQPDQFLNFVGGSPRVNSTDNEWYTLSENLYRAYAFTGNPVYRDFAEVWHYTTYWNAIAEGKAAAMTGLHAYSHVNNLSGAAMAYQVSGDPNYLKTITTAYDLLMRYQVMASGGYGPEEIMADPKGTNGERLLHVAHTFEAPCGSWAAFKLSRYLMIFTGTAAYGDWVEALLYNAIGAALPIKDDEIRRGKTFYYADYRVTGGRKTYNPLSFPCCSGTYPLVVSDYYNQVYFFDANSLYVNLYLPSRVSFNLYGSAVTVEQTTRYPEENSTSFKVSAANEISFSLKLRIPKWADQRKMKVTINGQAVPPTMDDAGWLVIDRTWKNSDVASLSIPLSLRFMPIDLAHPHRAALMYGPVMLAMMSPQGGPLNGNIENPEDWIQPVQGEALHFKVHTPDNSERIFLPFYEIGERVRYYVYNDIEP